jgi:hypothetical protein
MVCIFLAESSILFYSHKKVRIRDTNLVPKKVAGVPKALPVLRTPLPLRRGGSLQDVDIGGI